jgi:hypothetical protein
MDVLDETNERTNSWMPPKAGARQMKAEVKMPTRLILGRSHFFKDEHQ